MVPSYPVCGIPVSSLKLYRASFIRLKKLRISLTRSLAAQRPHHTWRGTDLSNSSCQFEQLDAFAIPGRKEDRFTEIRWLDVHGLRQFYE